MYLRKHRIRFLISNKSPLKRSLDLENPNIGVQPLPATRASLLHSCHESGVHSIPTRWPSYSLDREAVLAGNTFAPFSAIPEAERSPTPATTSHFAPATIPRDHQGLQDQKP